MKKEYYKNIKSVTIDRDYELLYNKENWNIVLTGRFPM